MSSRAARRAGAMAPTAPTTTASTRNTTSCAERHAEPDAEVLDRERRQPREQHADRDAQHAADERRDDALVADHPPDLAGGRADRAQHARARACARGSRGTGCWRSRTSRSRRSWPAARRAGRRSGRAGSSSQWLYSPRVRTLAAGNGRARPARACLAAVDVAAVEEADEVRDRVVERARAPGTAARSTITPCRSSGSRYSAIAVNVAVWPVGPVSRKRSPTEMPCCLANCSSTMAAPGPRRCSSTSAAAEPPEAVDVAQRERVDAVDLVGQRVHGLAVDLDLVEVLRRGRRDLGQALDAGAAPRAAAASRCRS